MILIDANLLLYAKVASFPEHARTKEWLDERLSSPERCGIPWESITAFVRIGTNPRIFERPMDVQTAWEQVNEWLSLPQVWTPQPTESHKEILAALIPACFGNSGLIHDAHLGAIAIGHGLTVCSADADFARFAKVKWHNPLEA